MWAGIFLLIQSCLSVKVLEQCECGGVLEEAPFQVLTFCWVFLLDGGVLVWWQAEAGQSGLCWALHVGGARCPPALAPR